MAKGRNDNNRGIERIQTRISIELERDVQRPPGQKELKGLGY